jgi:lactam utilization protein B
VTAGTACEDEAQKAGLRTVREFFADRPLRADGSLLVDWARYFDPSPENVVERVSMFLSTGTIPAVDGGVVAVGGDCICLHSDNVAGASVVEAVRQALESAGVEPVAP